MRAIPVAPRHDRQAIGQRIRAARQARQMTIEQLSEATGLSKGFVSRVERDQTSPSVSTLIDICDVLNLNVGDLFNEPESHLITAAEAPTINLGGDGVTEYLLSPRPERRMQVITSVVAPGVEGRGGDLYTINAERELLTVVSGTVEFSLNGTKYTLNKGDSMTFSGREPHTWRALDPSVETRLLWVLVPAPWDSTS